MAARSAENASYYFDREAAAESAADISPSDSRGEYSNAGRALANHAGRNGNPYDFPVPDGTRNAAGWNAAGESFLNDIIHGPDTIFESGYGRINGTFQPTYDLRLPDGRGARFSMSGQFSGFLDPKF